METVYLDNAASSPLRESAKEALYAYITKDATGANPNALHSLGKHEGRILDFARKNLAYALGNAIRPHNIHFTSGGTESDNMALLGIALGARKKDAKRTKVLFSAIEHAAIKETADPLGKLGFEVEEIPVTKNGIVNVEALTLLISPEVALVSVQAVNNELGTIQPIYELLEVAHSFGAYFHTDAVQALSHITFDMKNIDAMSISAHKLGALGGSGALYIKEKVPFDQTRFGGTQEKSFRAGTQGVAAAHVFGVVAKELADSLEEREASVLKTREVLFSVLSKNPQVDIKETIEYDKVPYVPGVVSLTVPGIQKELLLMQLDKIGFAISSGSACSASTPGPSPAILALGLPPQIAESVIRISFDERISPKDMERFAHALIESVVGMKGNK